MTISFKSHLDTSAGPPSFLAGPVLILDILREVSTVAFAVFAQLGIILAATTDLVPVVTFRYASYSFALALTLSLFSLFFSKICEPSPKPCGRCKGKDHSMQEQVIRKELELKYQANVLHGMNTVRQGIEIIQQGMDQVICKIDGENNSQSSSRTQALTDYFKERRQVVGHGPVEALQLDEEEQDRRLEEDAVICDD